jgi:hypothetical protein
MAASRTAADAIVAHVTNPIDEHVLKPASSHLGAFAAGAATGVALTLSRPTLRPTALRGTAATALSSIPDLVLHRNSGAE